MNFSPKTLTAVTAAAAGAVLGLVSLVSAAVVVDYSGLNMFGFGFAGLLYIIVPVYFSVLGLVLSLIVAGLKTWPKTLGASLLFAAAVSMGYAKNALAMYFGYENFHNTYFKTDIFQICANFTIFPSIGFLIWNLKKRFDNLDPTR